MHQVWKTYLARGVAGDDEWEHRDFDYWVYPTGSVGDALMPYSERMDKAMKEIRVSCATPAPQRKWLEQIGQQLKVEVVVYREAFKQGQFKEQGRFTQINKVFKNWLEENLVESNNNLSENIS